MKIKKIIYNCNLRKMNGPCDFKVTRERKQQTNLLHYLNHEEGLLKSINHMNGML